jgi:hypothetical protein
MPLRKRVGHGACRGRRLHSVQHLHHTHAGEHDICKMHTHNRTFSTFVSAALPSPEFVVGNSVATCTCLTSC